MHPTEDRVVLGYGDTRHQSGALGSREGDMDIADAATANNARDGQPRFLCV